MPKILQLTNKPPWPPNEGGPMAMMGVTRGLLASGFDVKLLSVITSKSDKKAWDVPEELVRTVGYETILIDTEIKPFQAFRNLFSRRSYHIVRFESAAFRRRLLTVLREESVDAVILESIYMAPYIQVIRNVNPDIPVVLRAHNVEHRIWERIVAGERCFIRKKYLRYLTRKLKREEVQFLKDVDAIVPITPVDGQWFEKQVPEVPLLVLPFGIEITKLFSPVMKSNASLVLYHLGSMDWYPNIEAVQWLVDVFWPECVKRIPGTELHLAGRNMAKKWMDLDLENLKVFGEIEDAAEFVRSRDVLIAPIFSGSGIRIKILEAMSLGKVVVTTAVGAEGIDYCHGENILIAHDPDSFIEAVDFLARNPQEISRIGNNARMLVGKRYDASVLNAQLSQFLSDQVMGGVQA